MLKVTLSNADPNTWYAICSPTDASSDKSYDATFMASIFSKQDSTYIFATCTAEVTGDSVRIRNGSVVTGSQIGSMTNSQPLHVREVHRLL